MMFDQFWGDVDPGVSNACGLHDLPPYGEVAAT
jgi:hypothetical protein